MRADGGFADQRRDGRCPLLSQWQADEQQRVWADVHRGVPRLQHAWHRPERDGVLRAVRRRGHVHELAEEAAGIAQYMGHSLSTWAKYYDLSAKQRQRSKADKVLAAALAKAEWDGAGEVEEEADAQDDDSSDGESGLGAGFEGAAQLDEAEAGEAEADGVHSHLFKITPSPVAHDSGAGILPDEHRGEGMEGDGPFTEDLQPWGQLFSTELHEEDDEPPWLAGLMNRKAGTVLKRTRKVEQDCGFEPQRRRIPKLVLQQGRTYLSKPQCCAILTKPLLLAAMEQLFVWPLDQDGAAVGLPKKWNVIKLRKALHTGDDGASQKFK